MINLKTGFTLLLQHSKPAVAMEASSLAPLFLIVGNVAMFLALVFIINTSDYSDSSSVYRNSRFENKYNVQIIHLF